MFLKGDLGQVGWVEIDVEVGYRNYWNMSKELNFQSKQPMLETEFLSINVYVYSRHASMNNISSCGS